MEDSITIFKVVSPSTLAWPPGNVILKICFTNEEAEKYIREYPNILLRMFLKVRPEILHVRDTD